jgi:hypothetical protein
MSNRLGAFLNIVHPGRGNIMMVSRYDLSSCDKADWFWPWYIVSVPDGQIQNKVTVQSGLGATTPTGSDVVAQHPSRMGKCCDMVTKGLTMALFLSFPIYHVKCDIYVEISMSVAPPPFTHRDH